MKEIIDFKTYRYFYDVGIVRMNKATNEFERFLHGKFIKTGPITNLESRLHDARDDIAELMEASLNEVRFLYEELNPDVAKDKTPDVAKDKMPDVAKDKTMGGMKILLIVYLVLKTIFYILNK